MDRIKYQWLIQNDGDILTAWQRIQNINVLRKLSEFQEKIEKQLKNKENIKWPEWEM